MPGDSVATRRRILDAGIAEFAQHGIAGARIDRIAAASGSNKAMIYKYFGNKDQLFDAVFDAIVVHTMNDVPIDAADLPGYAVRMWDWYQAHPEMIRLSQWDQLERGGAGMGAEVPRKAAAEKLDVIAQGQAAGVVDARLPAATVLDLVLTISRTGLTSSDPAAQRAVIETAVRRVVSGAE